MKFEYSFEIRKGQNVEAYFSIPKPTVDDCKNVLFLLNRLKNEHNFKFKVWDI